MYLERILILLIIIALGMVGYMLWRAWQASRLARLGEAEAPDTVRRIVGYKGPAVLYFTSRDCTQCHYQQAPILSHLTHAHDIEVYRLEATTEDELIRYYGIMTVPSTVILDSALHTAAINHGLVPLDRLCAQLNLQDPGAPSAIPERTTQQLPTNT
jgi:hypothetical protein